MFYLCTLFGYIEILSFVNIELMTWDIISSDLIIVNKNKTRQTQLIYYYQNDKTKSLLIKILEI